MPRTNDPDRRARFEALGRIGFGIATAGTRQMLDEVVNRVTPLLEPGQALSVVLWNPHDETFEDASSTVPGQGSDLAARRVRRSRGASRWIVDHLEPLLIDDVADDPFGANAMLREYGMHTYLGVPIVSGGAALGVLYALAPDPGSFDAGDLEFLRVVAARASGAIQVGIERDRTLAALARSRALHAIAATLNATRPLVDRLDDVAEQVRSVLQAGTVAVVPRGVVADVLPRGAVAGPWLRPSATDDAAGVRDVVGATDGVLTVPVGGDEPLGWVAVGEAQLDDSDVHRFLAIVAEQVATATTRERALHDLEVSNATLAEFAQVVSHDLKTPLTSLVGFLDLLREHLRDADEITDDFLRRSYSSARRLAAIIDALLEHATQRGQALEVQAVPLDRVVATVLDSLDAQIEITDATVDVAALLTVSGDERALELVVQNLVANALKYVRDGTTPRVRIESTTSADGVELHVVDEGPGVPEELRDTVFGLFERGAQHATAGLGIGLATVRALVSRMGGEVWLAGNAPHGTRAVVRLPAAASAAGRDAPVGT